MYEFHGWATIHESTVEVDSGRLGLIVKGLNDYISNLQWNSGLVNIYPANGMYHLSLGGYLNRKSAEADEIIKLYRLIAEQAPGSYGVLYTRDDEDTDGFENEFRVLVLVRGILQEKKDTLLSPFIPIVEDE
ncbi:Imm7 family immunity protein [Paenibacillus apiarius]|uniref:Imm7 family immunity protein n=1 Tax=Paenibacillus apiarius TaxID=46240 RepID=UPI003B3A5BF6